MTIEQETVLAMKLMKAAVVMAGLSKHAGLGACASLITTERVIEGSTEEEFAEEARTWFREAVRQLKEGAS